MRNFNTPQNVCLVVSMHKNMVKIKNNALLRLVFRHRKILNEYIIVTFIFSSPSSRDGFGSRLLKIKRGIACSVYTFVARIVLAVPYIFYRFARSCLFFFSFARIRFYCTCKSDFHTARNGPLLQCIYTLIMYV